MDEVAEMLDKEGWDLECWSPLEIRHRETGSFATGIAADFIIDHYKDQAKELARLATRGGRRPVKQGG